MKYAILLATLLALPVHAEFKDGNSLLTQLRSDNMEQVNALGYITGVYDVMLGINHCPPGNVRAGQISDMVFNYLTNVPAERHRTGDVIVMHVLKTAWPCAERAAPRGRSL